MRTIIAGSRGVTDYQALLDAIETANLFEGIVPTSVVSGAEPTGVDALGERWAKEQGLPLTLYPANWRMVGPIAGFQRNYTMSQNADALIALWDGHSPGTRHMIRLARQYKLAVYVAETR
jgi:hypothetical protein